MFKFKLSADSYILTTDVNTVLGEVGIELAWYRSYITVNIMSCGKTSLFLAQHENEQIYEIRIGEGGNTVTQ